MHSDALPEEIAVDQDGRAIRGQKLRRPLPSGLHLPVKRAEPALLDRTDLPKATLRKLYATPRSYDAWTKKEGNESRKLETPPS